MRAPLPPSRLGGGPAAAAVICLAALAVALAHLPGAVRGLDNRAAHNAQQSASDRDLEVARFVGISTDFVLAAQRVVPAHATYVVDTGPAAHPSSPLTLTALHGYLQNLLLPRLADLPHPQWLLCYGCDRTRWPIGRVAWQHGALAIARLSG